jgi:NAD-dependent deacetylase sirtuin 4
MPPVRAPLMRIPYTSPLPAPRIIPASASTASGAIAALAEFLGRSDRASSQREKDGSTLLLTGAGISVASGLADYRGANGTYTLNKTYRPVYYNEFCENHEMRKRYWARSFLGWTNMLRARPNAGHKAVAKLGELGIVRSVITQSTSKPHLCRRDAFSRPEEPRDIMFRNGKADPRQMSTAFTQ